MWVFSHNSLKIVNWNNVFYFLSVTAAPSQITLHFFTQECCFPEQPTFFCVTQRVVFYKPIYISQLSTKVTRHPPWPAAHKTLPACICLCCEMPSLAHFNHLRTDAGLGCLSQSNCVKWNQDIFNWTERLRCGGWGMSACKYIFCMSKLFYNANQWNDLYMIYDLVL